MDGCRGLGEDLRLLVFVLIIAVTCCCGLAEDFRLSLFVTTIAVICCGGLAEDPRLLPFVRTIAVTTNPSTLLGAGCPGTFPGTLGGERRSGEC